MLLNDEEIQERLNSPLNLLNRLRTATTPPTNIPSMPAPTTKDIGLDVEGKLAVGKLRESAADIMALSLAELRTRISEISKPESLARIAGEMNKIVQTREDEGKKQGYGLTRLWANMEWALEDMPGVHDIVEYETKLNQVLPKYDDIVVCTYDLTKFSAPVVMDILRTHPHVIDRGEMLKNPYYQPPIELLRDLLLRPKAQEDPPLLAQDEPQQAQLQ